MTNNKTTPSGVTLLASLRQLMPLRSLAYWEHLIVAEHQATRLLSRLDQTAPGVSLDWLSKNTLGNVEVVMKPRWNMEGISGFTKWADGHWLIGVNKSNPQARRRFTLCHEFKHALDGNREKITHRNVTPEQRERIADFFAASYLMPKMLVRQAWTRGLQDPEALAGLFKVSTEAMTKRLKYLQYLDGESERPTHTYFRQQSTWFRRLHRGDEQSDEYFGTPEAA